MRNYILCTLCMLLLGCYKIYPNKLTPKELEIDASEQVVYVNATRKIDIIDIVSSADSYPDSKKGEETKDFNGILVCNGVWFNARINTNDLDSCNVIKFYFKKNDSGEKRKIVYTVKGDIHFQMPVGSITQSVQ